MNPRGNAFALGFGHAAAEVCRVRPNCGARSLRGLDELNQHARRQAVVRGICPDCKRLLTVTRTGVTSAHGVCPKCGGEGYDVGPNSGAWKRMKLEEELKGSKP